MARAKKLTIKLTAREAHIVRGFLDGCLDAGACEGGITPEERDALLKVADALAAWEEKGNE